MDEAHEWELYKIPSTKKTKKIKSPPTSPISKNAQKAFEIKTRMSRIYKRPTGNL